MKECFVSGPPESRDRWHAICDQADRDKAKWCDELKGQGVKAAHPDDGWVDREKNSVYFAYPHFDLGVQVGDLIALGWHFDKTRIVEVVEIKDEGILGPGLVRYYFIPHNCLDLLSQDCR